MSFTGLNLLITCMHWKWVESKNSHDKLDRFTLQGTSKMILLKYLILQQRDGILHWLIQLFRCCSDLKMSVFLAELERGRKTSQFLMQKAPHIVPFDEVCTFSIFSFSP